MELHAFPGLGNAVVRGAGGSGIIENKKDSLHFLVWVMLWRGAGCSRKSRIIENVLNSMHGLGNAVVNVFSDF